MGMDKLQLAWAANPNPVCKCHPGKTLTFANFANRSAELRSKPSC
jgi:hypothetical protein